jgi:hypothetical protein
MVSIEGLTWGVCDRCGGNLPLIDGDNDCSAPSVTRGECPGYVTAGGNCGCYDDDDLAVWVVGLAEQEHNP